jgi:hypothetical protein
MSFAFAQQSKTNKAGDAKTSTTTKHHSSSSSPHHHRINNFDRNSPDYIFQLQRAIDNQTVQRLICSNNVGFNFAKIGILQPKLKVSQPGDEYEQEADRVAEQVMKMSTRDHTFSPSLQNNEENLGRKCSACEMAKDKAEKEKLSSVSTKSSNISSQETIDGFVNGINNFPHGAGSPLDTSTKKFMESSLGFNFKDVRVHFDDNAGRSARSINALAYTIGNNIVFDKERYQPNTNEGRRLLAHELVHTVQQSYRQLLIQRAPDDGEKATGGGDPLCDTFDFDAASHDVLAMMKVYISSKMIDDKLLLIRALKLIRRCATTDQQEAVKKSIAIAMLGTEATEVWDEAGKPFGGFIGMYPGFAPDIKKRLEKLGASETLEYGAFELSDIGATHRRRAKETASRELTDLGRTDIVYFRGHQFAQYKAPGVFTNGNVERGFDLRYIDQKGGFPNVKVMISTSCATLCKEPFELFHGLFPNAVILGYRKSAPIDGAGVRDAFHKGIVGLRRPLLLDQPVDISAILSVWKSVIESKHKGETGPSPGYYDGSTLHYWDGTTWHSIAPSDPANKCRLKGYQSTEFPAP